MTLLTVSIGNFLPTTKMYVWLTMQGGAVIKKYTPKKNCIKNDKFHIKLSPTHYSIFSKFEVNPTTGRGSK